MKIAEISQDLEDDMVDIEGTVKQVLTPRAISTDYGQKTMAIAELEDDTGSIKLELWGNKAKKIEQGDSIEVNKAYVKEFNGRLFVNVSKEGSIEKL